MKSLEFFSIVYFFLSATAGEDSYGFSIMLLILAGVCAVLSSVIPDRKKVKKCIRR